MKYYIAMTVNYDSLAKYLEDKDKVIFYIDVPSICRGLHVKEVILREAELYFTNNIFPTTLTSEMRDFLNGIYRKFRKYQTRFILFFDRGRYKQNREVYEDYKKEKDDDYYEVYKLVRNYYYDRIKNKFVKPGLSTVIDANEYESDFVPYYIISNKLAGSADSRTLNIVMSHDKDLLQCCKFDNVVQYCSAFKNGNLVYNIYDRKNCMNYFFGDKDTNKEIRIPEYIPFTLAVVGDKSDGLYGVRGIGFGKIQELLMRLRPQKIEDFKMVLHTEDYERIERNYKIISFDEQIKRVDNDTLEMIRKSVESL